MAKVVCSNCNEELDEIIRMIQVRCRFDEEADDYLMQEDEGYSDLCPKCKAELEDA